MELISSRWNAVRLAGVCGLFLAAMVATAMSGSRLAPPVTMTILFGLPVLGYMLPPRVLARIDGQTLWVGARSARIPDLVDIHTHTVRVNFIPTSRTMIFSFRARDGGSKSVRKLALAVGRVAGGRKAAEAFAGLVVEVAGGRIATPESEAEPNIFARRPAAAAPSVQPGARNDDFDPDAIIARYMTERSQDTAPEPAAPPARPTFGRKGL